MTNQNGFPDPTAGRLRLAHRPLWPPVRSSGLASSGAAGLAQAIRTRYGLAVIGPRSPARVWRRRGLALLVQQASHHYHLSLAPRLALTMVVPPDRQPAEARGQTRPAGAPRWSLRSPTAPVQAALAGSLFPGSGQTVAPVSTLLLRPTSLYPGSDRRAPLPAAPRPLALWSREGRVQSQLIAPAQRRLAPRLGERLELVTTRVARGELAIPGSRPGPTARPVVTAGRQPGPLPRPVPRVVYRPAAVPAESSEAASRFSPVAAASRPFESPGMPATSPESLPPFQLNRLADQVVRVIDQRTIAYRERRGRI